MAKGIPVEQLISLHHRMSPLSARDPQRRHLILEMAEAFDVSESTVRRQLKEHIRFSQAPRTDKNQPRITSHDDMLKYCQLIAALKLRTINKKDKHLSTESCIQILEDHGVETEDGLIMAPKALLKKSTINRYLKNWGYDFDSMRVEPAVVRFEAEYSNDCWQFDFTPSELKKLPEDSGKTLYIANITDDKSGVLYFKYILSNGEDALTALRFLFDAMSSKVNAKIPFQGIPKMIYTDNGAFSRSAIFKRALVGLGVQLKTHLPKDSDGRRTTARAKGKVERTNRTIKESFEPLFHLHKPSNIEEANEWEHKFLIEYNQKPHRSESDSRINVWKKSLPKSGFQEMCSWEKFCQIVREPEYRKVESDGCVNVDGVRYQLSTEMAGLEVMLMHGVFDNELHVEFKNECCGPYYPWGGPIPLHTYQKFKSSSREKQANEIESIAKKIAVPRSVMTGQNNVVRQLRNADLIENEKIASTPFHENQEPQKYLNQIEAKQAIAQYLNRPLAELTDNQNEYINHLISETLEKEEILSNIKNYFSLTLCQLVK